MKKVFFATLVAVAISSTAVAQEYPKFEDTQNSVEIGFNPFSNTFQTFRIDELKYRRFFGQNALRVRLGFGINSDKTTNNNNTAANPISDALNPVTGGTTTTSNVETKTTNNTTNFNIFVGYERHFDLSQGISLYAGAEIGYELESNSRKVETNTTDNTRTLTYYGGTSSYTNYTSDFVESKVDEYKKRNSYGAFAANIFTGVDVNIYKGLYLGAELGLGLKTKSYKTPERTSATTSTQTDVTNNYNVPGATNTTVVTAITSSTDADGNTSTHTLVTTNGVATLNQTATGKNYNVDTDKSEFNLKLYASPALRIGWRF